MKICSFDRCTPNKLHLTAPSSGFFVFFTNVGSGWTHLRFSTGAEESFPTDFELLHYCSSLPLEVAALSAHRHHFVKTFPSQYGPAIHNRDVLCSDTRKQPVPSHTLNRLLLIDGILPKCSAETHWR